MEQQNTSKVSRSAARHLRRKKLVAARKETNKVESSFDCINHQKIAPVKKEISGSECSSNTENIQPSKITFNNGEICSVKADKDILKNYRNIEASKSSGKNDALTSKKQQEAKINRTCEQTNITSSVAEISKNSESAIVNSDSQVKMESEGKIRGDVEAERKAKKAAKAAAKAKAKGKMKTENESIDQVDDVQKVNVKEKLKLNLESVESSLSSLSISKAEIDCKSTKVAESNKCEDKRKIAKEVVVSDSAPKTEEKSKAELRAERRAKQEAQRAAKQAADKGKVVKSVPEKASQVKSVESTSPKEAVKKASAKSEVKDSAHEVKLFKHLYINRKNRSEVVSSSNVKLHPAILKLGVQYAEKVIVGSNARCVALLAAIKQLIQDFERPSQADFTRGLETSLQESVNYLNSFRPSAVSMQNALKHLKWQMSTFSSTISDDEAKSKLSHAIDTYIREQILLADTAISEAIQGKISNGDVILTYGFSSLIYKILCDAFKREKQFRVIIIDSRPWLEGKELLRRLVKHGIDCSYMLINALSYIMPQVNKVFVGAHAILANGAVMSRVGTAQVALMAKAFNVPVLVACETHKSCERVQTDSIVYNELGDPDLLVNSTLCTWKKSSLANWRSKKTLNLLNITYDVTPADLVTAVVTELAILPCTSVPVILRIKPSEI